MSSKKFKIDEAFEYGWMKTKLHLNFFLVLFFLFFFSALLLDIFSSGNELTRRISIGLGSIFSLMFGVGVTKSTIRILHDEQPTLDDFILRDFGEAMAFIGGVILYCLLVFLGTLLFVVPGIILAIRLKFYPYLIIDKQLDPLTALRVSLSISKGHVWLLTGFTLLVILLNAIASFLFGIGLIFTVPLSIVAMGYIYAHLLGEGGVISKSLTDGQETLQ